MPKGSPNPVAIGCQRLSLLCVELLFRGLTAECNISQVEEAGKGVEWQVAPGTLRVVVTSEAGGSGMETSSGNNGTGAGTRERSDGGSGKHLAMLCVSPASCETCGRRKKTYF